MVSVQMESNVSDMKDKAEAGAPEPHAAELTVWGVPSAPVVGGRMHFMVGARCSAGCDLGGSELGIYDQQGVCIDTAKLGHEVWPGTEALYVAEVQISAPVVGSHQWEVKAATWVTETLHVAGSFSVVVRVVTAPDCEVTVTAVDRESQAPIAGACVVMHPYRAMTDENGIATIRVAKGDYDILVSGRGHLPICNSVEVTAKLTTRVELDAERPWVGPDEDHE